jgi:(1->4)-alpha-D-glucan 1-alpha-D-glucosylmutase
VATRLPVGLSRRGGWVDTVVHLPPGTWRDAIAGNSVLPGAAARVGDVLRRYPAALLLAE